MDKYLYQRTKKFLEEIGKICEKKVKTDECNLSEDGVTCCELCGENNAYFTKDHPEDGEIDLFIGMGDEDISHESLRDEADIKKLKNEYNFDEEDGFLRENGCCLPREKRPTPCLVYICEDLAEEIRENYNIPPYQLLKQSHKIIKECKEDN